MEEVDMLKKFRDRIISKIIISYPYCEKSKEEIIADSKERSKNKLQEYAIYRIGGELSCKTHMLRNGNTVESKYICLEPTANNATKTFKVNVSSFNFPFQFPFDHDNKFNELYCSVNNVYSFETKNLLRKLIDLSHEEILITRCLNGMDKFGNFRNVFHVYTLPENDSEKADFILKKMTLERIHAIKEILEKPIEFLTIYDLEIFNIVKISKHDFIEPIKSYLLNQLQISESFMETNSEIFKLEEYYDGGASERELQEDTMNAMSDGNWDYPDEYYYDDDDRY